MMISILLLIVLFIVLAPAGLNLLSQRSYTPPTGQGRHSSRRTVRPAGAGPRLYRVRAWHAPMRSSNWGELLLPVIYEFFDIGRRLRPALRPVLYNVIASTRSREDNVGYGGIAPDAWGNYKNSGAKSTVDFDKGFTASYIHDEFVVQFQIERKLRDDDQYGVMGERARKLGISATQKMEIDAASVFNNAFSTAAGHLGPDGKPLCSTTHPRNPNKGGSLVNAGTYALTKGNIGLVRTAMMEFVDDAGNKLGVTPDTLLVPPALEDTALEIARSSQDPESANNAINPQAGRYRVIPWHFLTDSDNWFLIDSVWMRESLKWYERSMLEITVVGESTTESVFEAYMRYSFGFDDWRWVFGNNVT